MSLKYFFASVLLGVFICLFSIWYPAASLVAGYWGVCFHYNILFSDVFSCFLLVNYVMIHFISWLVATIFISFNFGEVSFPCTYGNYGKNIWLSFSLFCYYVNAGLWISGLFPIVYPYITLIVGFSPILGDATICLLLWPLYCWIIC